MAAPRFILDDFWPSDLFLGGIPGAWYDPTDLSTMFQDSTGTTPVTAVEQPVGLILDKSQGLALGAELVTNGDFSSGASWVLEPGWAIGAGLATKTAGIAASIYQPAPAMVQGRTYLVTFTVSGYTAGILYPVCRGTLGTGVTANGTYTQALIAGATAARAVEFFANATFAGSLDNVTVRELAGNHASQSTAASRPTYRARYNLLTFSEQFDNAAWTKGGLNTTGTPPWVDVTTAPDGTSTADRMIETVATTFRYVLQAATVVAGNYTFSVYAKQTGGAQRWLSMFPQGSTSAYAIFDINAGTVTSTGGANYVSSAVSSVGNGWFRCSVTCTSTAGTMNLVAYLSNSSTAQAPSYLGDGASGAFIWGAQLLTAADVTATGNAYQRIAAATVYDTAPIFRPYLAFDGMDDLLSTAAINFTSTDKMSVFSGVTKNSDSAFALIAELTTNADTFAGGFNFFGANQPGYYAQVGAIGDRVFGPGIPPPMSFATAAPTTDVVSLAYDRTIPSSVTQIQYRIDAQGPSSANLALQGVGASGVFANAQLFIGRRNNASFPFNGRIYSLIVRGAASSVTEIADTELWVNARTGGY